MISENQIVADLLQDFEKNQAPSTENIIEGEIIGEFNLPVSTEVVYENSQNLQSLVVDSLNDDQFGQNVGLLYQFDQKVGQEKDLCWSGTSLLSDVQDEDLTLAHVDPTLVTGQVIFMKLS